MKISTILDHIDSGHMALPEFQRGYVWNRDQVRALVQSLYRRYPVGTLLVWAVKSDEAQHRGEDPLAAGVVKLLLDGQQRITSLYGILRGEPPQFFDGNPSVFTGLRFHLESEEFSFYQPVKMRDDPLWIDVTELARGGIEGLGEFITSLTRDPQLAQRFPVYMNRMTRLLGILDVDLHIEEVTGADKTIDVVVEIFNRVNSGGTKLSKGDLALAKICAEWPEGREAMKQAVARWREEGDYHFELDWLLRIINTIVTGRAKFSHLHDVSPAAIQNGLKEAERSIDTLLNLIAGRLGLDHDRVLFGKFAFPVMARYLHSKGGQLNNSIERDRLLFWYVESAMWGRYSGSTETVIDQDLNVLEDPNGGLDQLIREIELWHGSLRVLPEHFGGWSLGARFYPVLYMLTRMGEARDWGLGIPLKHGMYGKMNRLEVHHIFPKARLYEKEYSRQEVNALANFCFQTKETNLQISDSLPEEYFPKIEEQNPGALASQWIPMDPSLWKIENYPEFLAARRELLASALNTFLAELAHDSSLLAAGKGEISARRPEDAAVVVGPAKPAVRSIPGAIESPEEEALLREINRWVIDRGLPEGTMAYELADPLTCEPIAILDLAWPEGLQPGLSQPVTLLIGEGPSTFEAANRAGFRYFTQVDEFKRYVREEILGASSGTPVTGDVFTADR